MDTIQLKSGRKRIAIQDENGTQRGEIVINPNDELFAEKMYRLIQEMNEKYDELQTRVKTVIGEQENVEEATWENMPELLALNKDAWDFIYTKVDSLFGVGTSEMVFQNERDRDVLMQFFEGILGYFHAARSDRLREYMPPNGNGKKPPAKRRKRK